MMKTSHWLAALAGLSLCVGLSVAQAIAKDSDFAGVSDEIQHRLGIDADATRRLEVVWESPKPAASDASRDIRRILLGNVAGNRYLWVLEFAAEFPFKNTNLTVYVDADNNPKHGQKSKEYMGTDFVMWLSDGGRCCHGYSIPGEGAAPAPRRFAWQGKRVYLCSDMPLARRTAEPIAAPGPLRAVGAEERGVGHGLDRHPRTRRNRPSQAAHLRRRTGRVEFRG